MDYRTVYRTYMNKEAGFLSRVADGIKAFGRGTKRAITTPLDAISHPKNNIRAARTVFTEPSAKAFDDALRCGRHHAATIGRLGILCEGSYQ